MKRAILLFTSLFLLASCGAKNENNINIEEEKESEEVMEDKLITISDATHSIQYKLNNNSSASKSLLDQLPFRTDTVPFSNNEITFYPDKKLDVANTPLADGEIGILAYYAPWGDVVMFFGEYSRNSSLYELGKIVSDFDDIKNITGKIEIK